MNYWNAWIELDVKNYRIRNISEIQNILKNIAINDILSIKWLGNIKVWAIVTEPIFSYMNGEIANNITIYCEEVKK